MAPPVVLNDLIPASIEIPASEEDMIDLRDEIVDYTYSMIPKVVMAETDEEFEAAYNECLEGRRSMGLDTLIEWMQTRTDEAVAAYEAE